MAGLTAEQKRRIRKELQRRAQAKMAWKVGGGTKAPSQSMSGWAGFGDTGSTYHKDQLAYIKSLGAKGAGSDWKTAYKAAAKKGGKTGKAGVKEYIAKKGAGGDRPSPGAKTTLRTTKTVAKTGKDISGNKPAPRVITAGTTYNVAAKEWYAKHVKAGVKTKKQIRDTLKKKQAAGFFN